ncbi:MAG: hypothetical protein JO273_03625 [Methylobacteriaceae bacterium]|nr:hypothetical protein [Methylobacteriaceae bacterium]
MALTAHQRKILLALAANRSPDSYVAGASALNVSAPRLSTDIDIFHDEAARLEAAATHDAATLERAGFAVSWTRRMALLRTAVVALEDEETKLEWAYDSDFRFFPTLPDPLFGYRLHRFDLAANKIMAAADRREVRDIIDLVEIDRTYLPLGPLITAAVDKSPGWTPEGVVSEIRRNAMRPADDYRNVASEEPIDPMKVHSSLRSALDRADEFVRALPTEFLGVVFLEKGVPTTPNLERLSDTFHHRGSRRGHWPDSDSVRHEMWVSYRGERPRSS